MDIDHFKDYMKKNVLSEIITKPLVVKKTKYIYPNNVNFESLERVDSYYIENNKKFIWLNHWKGNVFIYGNPFNSYGF